MHRRGERPTERGQGTLWCYYVIFRWSSLLNTVALPNYDTMRAPILCSPARQCALSICPSLLTRFTNFTHPSPNLCSRKVFQVSERCFKFPKGVSSFRKVFQGPGRLCYECEEWWELPSTRLTREPAAAAPNVSSFVLLHIIRLRSLRRRSYLLVRQWEYSHVRWLLRPQQ